MKIASVVLNSFINDSRVLKSARSLRAHGHEVKVVALHEKGLPECEAVGDIDVQRIKLSTKDWSKNRLVQLIKYLEFLLRSMGLYRYAEVVHCNDLNALPVGALLKVLSLGRIKVVYDAHEYESNQVPNQSRLSIKLLQLLEGGLIRFADAVITVSEGIAREYARLYVIEKPTLVLNCPLYQEVEKKDRFRERFGISPEATIFLYQGGVSGGRGIERILDTFASLADPRLVVVVMGYGPLVGLVEAYAAKYDNIFYHPAVAPEGLLEYTASADCGLCLIEDSCFSYRYCLPNKLFEYIMAGLPALVSGLPELKGLVIEEGIGEVIDKDDCEGLAEAIERFKDLDRSRLRANLLRTARKYCWEEQETALAAIYGGLINA